MMTPAFLLFLGFQILAFAGLFYWNILLQSRLRFARDHETAPAYAPAAPVQPDVVEAAVAAPPALATVEPPAAPAAPAPDARQTDLERQLAEVEYQHQLLQNELTSLSYSVSHDLRAPLRAIDGFSQAIAEDYGHALDATAQGYLQRVRANARHMASLIDDLLVLSRLARATLNRRVVDLAPLAESIMSGLRKSDPERVVVLEVQSGLRAFADADLMETVFRQLLGNAWKFTARRPVAHVLLSAKIALQENGEREAVYEVRDDGTGFDMNYAGKLFGAFQRMHTTEEFSGNGIGLAVVQRIVRRHGGRTWAEAKPDEGTSIFFTLGAADGCEAALVPAETGGDAHLAPEIPVNAPVSYSSSTVL